MVTVTDVFQLFIYTMLEVNTAATWLMYMDFPVSACLHRNNIIFNIKSSKVFGSSRKSRTFAPHLKNFY